MHEHPSEITVVLKSDDGRYTQKFLVYEAFQCNPDDVIIKGCIDEALANTKLVAESVKIKISMEV